MKYNTILRSIVWAMCYFHIAMVTDDIHYEDVVRERDIKEGLSE